MVSVTNMEILAWKIQFGTKIKIEFEHFLGAKIQIMYLQKIKIEFELFLARKFKLFTKKKIK